MKKITAIILFILMATSAFAVDKRIQSTEKMVGANHPTLTDTLNRLTLVEHNSDGTHSAAIATGLDIAAYSTIALADAAAIAAGKGLVCNSAHTISTAITITSPFKADKGCMLSKAATGAIDFMEPVEAGLYQWIDTAGSDGFVPGDITGLFEANIMWFGAHSSFKDGYETFDNSSAINTAFAAFGNKGILYAPKGRFRYGSTLNKKPGTRYIGIGADFDDKDDETEEWVGTTMLWTSTTGTSVEVLGGMAVTAERQGHGSYWHGGFEQISFKGEWATMVDAIAIAFIGSKKEHIERCDIRYFGTGVRAEFYDGTYPGEIRFKDSYLGFMKQSSVSMDKAVDCYFEATTLGGNNYGLDLNNCNAFEIDTIRAQNGLIAGVHVNNSMNIKFNGGWFDANGDATHTAHGAVVENSNDISFLGNTFYDNTGDGLVFINSHECKVQGCSFGRHGQVGGIDSSGIVIMSDSSIGTGDTYRMSILGNFFTVNPYERTVTDEGTLARGILVTNGTNSTDFVRQLSIIGNDFFVETALHLENGDVVTGNTSNLTTGIFAHNNITGVTNIIKNPGQLSTNEFQYSRDWQTPAPAAITTKVDEDVTISLYGDEAKAYQFATPLTTTRTVTLANNSPIGSAVEILRTGASTGSSLLTIKKEDGTTVENLGTNQWMKAIRIAGAQAWARISSGATTYLFGTTPTFNPGLMSAGTCTTRTTTIVNATVGSAVVSSPVTTYPGDGVIWDAYVSAANTVTYRLCTLATTTPSVTTYKITVFK